MNKRTFTCWHDDPTNTWTCEDWYHEGAAEAYVKHCESEHDGWEWLDGAEIFVSAEDGDVRKFDVEAEKVIQYIVSEDDEWEPEAA